jgi:hypothetical protein
LPSLDRKMANELLQRRGPPQDEHMRLTPTSRSGPARSGAAGPSRARRTPRPTAHRSGSKLPSWTLPGSRDTSVTSRPHTAHGRHPPGPGTETGSLHRSMMAGGTFHRLLRCGPASRSSFHLASPRARDRDGLADRQTGGQGRDRSIPAGCTPPCDREARPGLRH